MITYNNRNYYTLYDCLKDAYSTDLTNTGPFALTGGNKTTRNLIYTLDRIATAAGYTSLTNATYASNDYLWTVWKDYIFPRFWNSYVCWSDDEDSTASKAFAEEIGKIYSWIISSTDKYSQVIENFENNKAKLLDEIKTYSVDRFNDTPQNDGTYDDDTHNTNVTKHESTSLGGTMMARLKEVESNIEEYYKEWSDEFRKFILWSV